MEEVKELKSIIILTRYLDSREAIVEDILNLILLTEKNYKNVDKFIMGYSLGACISSIVVCMKENLLNGAILISPSFQINYQKYNKWKNIINFIGKFFSQLPLIKSY
jgi:alpha-beta hydrolase superfamily lysophospholipase